MKLRGGLYLLIVKGERGSYSVNGTVKDFFSLFDVGTAILKE